MSNTPPVVLKPCPFCGNTKEPVLTSSYEIGPDCDCKLGEDQTFSVICNAEQFGRTRHKGCGASGGFKPTEREAVEAWNTRAVPLEPDEEGKA